jgi:putative ABC transport system permease protein
MVTFLFGTLGMMAGIGLTELLNALIGTPQGPVSQESMVFFTNPTVDPAVVLSAVSVLITAGLLAGFMPARRAVQVKPIEALRYE